MARSVTNTFSSGETIVASEVNQNFTDILNIFNSSGIQTAEIQNNAITSDKIAAGAVDTSELAADSVSNAKLDPAHTKSLIFEYDFGDLGGGTGTITLTDTADVAQTIPDNSVIVNAWVEAITTATSGGSATISLGYTGNTDAFLPATAFDNGEFTAEAITISGLDLPVKTTAAVSVLATIGTAALTAGKFRVHVDYKEGA